MSYTELHTGMLHKINNNQSVKEWVADYSNKNGIDCSKLNNDNWEEYAMDIIADTPDLYNNYYIDFTHDIVYKILNHKEYSDEDIDIWEEESNGDIRFVTQFYNGGTCFVEVLENGLANIHKNN